MLAIKRLGIALLLAAIAPVSVLAQPAAQGRKPLTEFQPSHDFFPVPNQPKITGGSCLGIAESAITYWNSNPPSGQRLAALGNDLLRARNPMQGSAFLQEINRFAQNHSCDNARTAPHGGENVAEILFNTLTKTHQPQVLGLDLPQDEFQQVPRHALVVYDAEKTPDGRFVFHVGDPNYPNRDDLTLSYAPSAGGWQSSNFPTAYTGADHKPHPMIEGFQPNFVHWDSSAQAMGQIPKSGKFLELINWARQAVGNPRLTTEYIGLQTQLQVPGTWSPPETEYDLSGQQPQIQAELDTYEASVAAHNAEVRMYNDANSVFESKYKAHYGYVERFNAAAQKYRTLPAASREQAEATRLNSMRAVIIKNSQEYGRQHDSLTSTNDRLRTQHDRLEEQRSRLVAQAASLGWQISATPPASPDEVAAMPIVLLVVIEEPGAGTGAPSVEGSTWSGSGGTLSFRSGKAFVFTSPRGERHTGSWSQSGDVVSARYQVKYPYATMYVDFRFSIGNGTADCEMKISGVDVNQSSFTIRRQ